MTPEEFVKKYGISGFKVARSLPAFKRYKYTIIYSDEIDFSNEFVEKHKNYMFESQEIKRLVESHDLVKEWHLPEDDETGLDGSYLYLDYYASYTSDEEKAKLDRLKQAIADVEACQ